MKALTICQPYAALIMLPDGNQRAKRVENRTWPTSYRGPLLIHAGKSRDWIKKLPTSELKAMKLERVTFGEIIGVAQLCDCIELKQYMSRRSQQFGREALERWPWLLTHEHAHGPVCWIL